METIDKIDAIDVSKFQQDKDGAVQLATELMKIVSEHCSTDAKYLVHLALHTPVVNKYELLAIANSKNRAANNINNLIKQLQK